MMSMWVNERKFYEDVTGFNNFIMFIITNKLNDIFLFRINYYTYQEIYLIWEHTKRKHPLVSGCFQNYFMQNLGFNYSELYSSGSQHPGY